jgi:hypothetical protein
MTDYKEAIPHLQIFTTWEIWVLEFARNISKVDNMKIKTYGKTVGFFNIAKTLDKNLNMKDLFQKQKI